MKLDGFGIFVKDMPTMIQFYRDVLGFDIKEQENHEDEEQKSFEERQMKKLFDILYFWKDEKWHFTYLMDVNGYLIDLVRRYDKRAGELIAILEEEINQIKAMVDAATPYS